MTDVLLFGGTSEGRLLAEGLQQKGVSALVCVATEYGEALLTPGGSLRVRAGRLDADGIQSLLTAERPRRVIDATHPYARTVSDCLRAACDKSGTVYLRVRREACGADGCMEFDSMNALLAWLNTQEGVIFSMLGAKEASALTAIKGYRERVRVRVLPALESLTACLNAGFPAKHVICMQGPFSEELNVAMLQATGAKIAVTKESGSAGGFPEKLAAARKLGIPLAVLRRPQEEAGCTLPELLERIEEGTL